MAENCKVEFEFYSVCSAYLGWFRIQILELQDLLKTIPILTKTIIILVATMFNIVAPIILIVLPLTISNILNAKGGKIWVHKNVAVS